MRIVALIARILLGLMFVVFGLNGFLHFIPMGPMPTGVAGQFAGALFVSHYMYVVAALQVIGGALVLSGFYVPLGLTLLGPVIGPPIGTVAVRDRPGRRPSRLRRTEPAHRFLG